MKLKIAVLLSLISSVAFGQIYQWKDANGRTVVSDTPPPGSVASKRRLGGESSEPASQSNGSAKTDTPKSSADKNLEFKKRQQESKERSDKSALEQKNSAERQESCRRAQQAVASLESGQAMTTVNERGENQIMDQSSRQAELDRARQSANEACK